MVRYEARILDVEAIVLLSLSDWAFNSLDTFKQLYLGSELINQFHIVFRNSYSESFNGLLMSVFLAINHSPDRLRLWLALVLLVVAHVAVPDNLVASRAFSVSILLAFTRRGPS